MKRLLMIAAGLLSVSLLLTSCGGAPSRKSGSSTTYGDSIPVAKNFDPNGHFNWGFTVYPVSWDPTKSVSGGAITFYAPVYDRLLYEDPDGKVQPMLATAFTPSADNKTLTLQLRKGLTFSDGTPFNAEAVKFNLDRNRGEGSNLAGSLSQIASVDVVDADTVDIHITDRIGSLPVALANVPGVMVSPAAVKAGTVDAKPVGIGPYVATSLQPGNKVEYKKSPDYWDPDAQRVATMTYFLMTDDQTRTNALKSGQIDGAVINPDQMNDYAAAGFTPIIKQSALFLYLSLNTSQAPLDNPEVRKALNMAIDRKGIAQGLYDGYCTPQIQPFPKGSPGYSEKIGDGLDVFPHDTKAAKKILKDAGVTSLDMTIAAPTVTIFTKFAEILQSELAKVGVNVKIHSLPPAEMVKQFSVDKTANAMASITTTIDDPDAVNSTYITPNSLGNPGGTNFPKLMEYADAGASSLDPAQRTSAYEKYMDAWVADPPNVIPVCMVQLPSAYAKKVSGVSQTVSGYTDLRGVAVSKG